MTDRRKELMWNCLSIMLYLNQDDWKKLRRAWKAYNMGALHRLDWHMVVYDVTREAWHRIQKCDA